MTATATRPEQAALAEAIQRNNLKAVQELLQRGADVNEEVKGETMLMRAIVCGCMEMVGLLVNMGADVNKRDKTRLAEMPLIEAAYRNNAEAVFLLIDRGADVDARNGSGHTALMFSSVHMNIKIMRLLLDYGANVNLRACNGDTALSIAEEKNRRVLEREIILSAAEEYCHEEMVRLLKEAQAGQRKVKKVSAAQRQCHATAARKQQKLNAAHKPLIIRRPQP